MGNNPSKTPGDVPPTSNTSVDRRASRRPSVHVLPGAVKATAVDPSASKETAVRYSATQNATTAQRRLQSRSVADSPTHDIDRLDSYDTKRIVSQLNNAPVAPDPSGPVQVPTSRPASKRDPFPPVTSPVMANNTYYSVSTHLQRPPRMPLPIADAAATPGSPATGLSDSHMGSFPHDRLLGEHGDPEAPTVEEAAIDEDDIADQLQPYTVSGIGKAVPTVIQWTGNAQRVYVTGTFVNWEKKFRLHRNENNGGVMSTTLNLRPGTHHLKFIVDGEMRASDNLPTAVDFTNHLVNYIEISTSDVSQMRRGSDKDPKASFPSEAHSAHIISDPRRGDRVEDSVQEETEEPEEIPPGDFRNIIPRFLTDLDQEEESFEYQQAASVIGDANCPPSLPLFLGKSILNGTTPMKDDSSVLNYPNHTVLNHLATSSIKNGVLATSVTTRYRRKYVTTILYKPTEDITG